MSETPRVDKAAFDAQVGGPSVVDVEVARSLEKALRRLFMASQNEMVSRGLPLEWREDTAMGEAQEALHWSKHNV